MRSLLTNSLLASVIALGAAAAPTLADVPFKGEEKAAIETTRLKSAARRADLLTEEERNELLASMTEEVGAIVLEDNRLQALAISIAEQGGDAATASTIRLIETLEDAGMLDRRTEGIADNETFTRRAGEGIGLTRPELAVLLSSAKLTLQDAIEAGGLPDDPTLESTLFQYFPVPLREKYAEQISQHRLRTEIIATDLANRIVNRMGMVHPFELAEEEGVGLNEVASAFVTTFAGLVADPVQVATGTHRRRLERLFRRLADRAGPEGLAREHVAARLGDIGDLAFNLIRFLRG